MIRLIVLACWTTVLLHSTAAVYAHHGSTGFVPVLLVAMIPLSTMATTVAAVIAAGLQRIDLFVAAMAAVVLSMLTASPQVGPAPVHPAALADLDEEPLAAELTIVSSNVRAGNPHLVELVAEVAASDPDVAVFLEVRDQELATLLATPMASSHPYVVADPRDGYHGSAVFSRYPIAGRAIEVGGYPMIEAIVDGPYGFVDLLAVHVAAPLSDEGHQLWADQLEELTSKLSAADRPFVMVGDFNATPQHRELRELATASSARALGVAPSYPAHSVMPPILELDHAFAAGGACIVDASGLPQATGSDHRALQIGVSYSAGDRCRY